MPLDSRFPGSKGGHIKNKLQKRTRIASHDKNTEDLKILQVIFPIEVREIFFGSNAKSERSVKNYLSFKVLVGN